MSYADLVERTRGSGRPNNVIRHASRRARPTNEAARRRAFGPDVAYERADLGPNDSLCRHGHVNDEYAFRAWSFQAHEMVEYALAHNQCPNERTFDGRQLVHGDRRREWGTTKTYE